jgi:hypothetical protein
VADLLCQLGGACLGGEVGPANPTAILQGAADDLSRQFARNPARIWTYAKKEELDALRANYDLGPLVYGHAFERALAAKIEASAALKEQFAYVAAPNRWDFEGLSTFQGIPFELTTTKAIPRHADRWYGPFLEYVTYERPADYLFSLLELGP